VRGRDHLNPGREHVRAGRVGQGQARAAGPVLEAIEDNAVTSVGDEPGCLRFDVVVDNDDPDHYLFYEVYRDAAAFAAHRDSEHFARWREAADVCLSEPLEATHTAMVISRGDRE
jgi:quinol monooxygenase YgiN